MEEHSLCVQKTIRFYTVGTLSKNTKQIWVVLHGYAQLAKDFVRKFEPLVPDDVFIIAPEAMHRFYAKGFSGNVGATWMTKEAREHDIQDNINYLNQLADSLELGKHKQTKLVLLGFSQGVATATRWFVHGNVGFDAMIMFAGEMAVELKTSPMHPRFTKAKTYFVYGNADPLLPSFAPTTVEKLFTENGIQTIEFNGGHDIDIEVIKLISSNLGM